MLKIIKETSNCILCEKEIYNIFDIKGFQIKICPKCFSNTLLELAESHQDHIIADALNKINNSTYVSPCINKTTDYEHKYKIEELEKEIRSLEYDVDDMEDTIENLNDEIDRLVYKIDLKNDLIKEYEEKLNLKP